MSLLHLQAEVWPDKAIIDSNAHVYLVVSITTAEGNPVNGLSLAESNFMHNYLLTAAASSEHGSSVVVNAVNEIGSTGIYEFELLTQNVYNNAVWVKGTYINSLQVIHGHAKGQVIYKIVIN